MKHPRLVISGAALAAAAAITGGVLLSSGGGQQSAQCTAAIRSNNAYVNAFQQDIDGPLTMDQYYAALAGAKRHAQIVVRLCGPDTKIEELST